MDLCFQVVVKEVLLITMLTVKTYLQLISIRSKDYLQFTSIKHSFQLTGGGDNNNENYDNQ